MRLMSYWPTAISAAKTAVIAPTQVTTCNATVGVSETVAAISG